MDGKTLARIGAIAFVTLAIVASAIEMNRKEDAAVVFAATAKFQPGPDPLAAELGRCSGLGEAGPRDPSCLAAWAANRRRFLGGDNPSAQIPPPLRRRQLARRTDHGRHRRH